MKFDLNYLDPKPLGDEVYKTDFFHKRPLFQVTNKQDPDRSYIVRSWEEAFAIHDEITFEDIHNNFLASVLRGKSCCSISPYKRIKRLPRSAIFFIQNGEISKFRQIDPFGKINDKISFEEFCSFFREKISNNIKCAFKNKKNRICVEHSSGLDSNSILGILVKKLNFPVQSIFTWTMETPSEMKLIEEFRSFYDIKNCNCLTPENQNIRFMHSKKERESIIRRLGAPLLVDTESYPYSILKKIGCNVLLSGLGGDQALSHHGINVRNDLARQIRLLELNQWTQSYFNTLKILLKNIHYSLMPNFYLKKTKRENKYIFIEKYLTLKGKEIINCKSFDNQNWEFDSSLGMKHSIKNRVSASWLTTRAEQEIRLARANDIDKFFPLLDEELIAKFISQDCSFFSDNQKEGRKVMREAFSDYLPPFLAKNPSKKREFDYENLLINIEIKNKKLLEDHLISSENWNPKLNIYIKNDLIKYESSNCLKKNVDIEKLIEIRNLMERLCNISDWFDVLES